MKWKQLAIIILTGLIVSLTLSLTSAGKAPWYAHAAMGILNTAVVMHLMRNKRPRKPAKRIVLKGTNVPEDRVYGTYQPQDIVYNERAIDQDALQMAIEQDIINHNLAMNDALVNFEVHNQRKFDHREQDEYVEGYHCKHCGGIHNKLAKFCPRSGEAL